MNHPSSTNLANVLQSTLSLVDYYGDTDKHGPALRELKLAITRLLVDMEAESAEVHPEQFITSDVPSDVQEVQVSRS
jgi:hypothetical protein